MKPKDGESKRSRPLIMRNALGLTSADDGQVEKKHTSEEYKPRSELQGGETPSIPASNLASSTLRGGLIMMHFHGDGHA